MAERITAERQLARILDLLPRAARAEGASLAELADAMGVEEREVVRDLTEVYTRAFYQPAGQDEDVQILIEGDHVTVWTTGEFRRPVRLSPRESLALGLALRVLAAGAGHAGAEAFLALAGRLEERLLDERGTGELPRFAIDSHALAAGGAHEVIAAAARDRRRCRIAYLKSGAVAPGSREIDPYVLLAADGRWYTIANCHRSAAIRVFRLDRILDAAPLDVGFDRPADFDATAYVADGRVYRAEDFEEIAVRYSPRVARWIAEQGPVEKLDDGSVLVRYSVADRSWLVRHVLEHGADAEVVGPPEVRAAVGAAARRALG